MKLLLAVLLTAMTPVFATNLTVSAAASLQGSLDEVTKKFETLHPGIHVALNFGASKSLAQQIENGAGVDVFISADEASVDRLKKTKLVVESRPLLANSLVLIVPADGKSGVLTEARSLAVLANPEVAHIAMGEPKSVPAGAYAMEALTHAGLVDAIASRLVFTKDVRQALAYVASGNADAGFVYATDALTTSKVRVVTTIPEDFHRPIVYPAALVKDSPDARAFYDFLGGNESLAVFQETGFHAAPDTE